MIEIKDKHNCCGCTACQQVCPKQCISLKKDFEGFEYPIVDKRNCIDCGLCEKCCPIINKRKKVLSNISEKVYMSYSKNEEVRLKSSSGGIFSLIAEQVLNSGGVVFGAAFDHDFSVHHIGIDSNEKMSALRGSKYVQSKIENTYEEAKSALESGKEVLFSGTACQIAGLKAFLKKDYQDLMTVDVLCHGVPSPKVWENYLRDKERKYGERIKSVSFRNKKSGWKTYRVLIEFNNGKQYENIFQKDSFMNMFLSNICLRPSCHECRFKEMSRPSDITLGDCWGIESHTPELDDDKGVSFVMAHSYKGLEMLDSIKEKMCFKEGNLDKVLPADADSRKSVMAHPRRKLFFRLLNMAGFDNTVKILGFLKKVKGKTRKIYARN